MGRYFFYPETADVYPGIVAHNKAVLEYEKFVQRTFHPNIIHPYSKFCVNWQITTVTFIAFHSLTIFFVWTTFQHENIYYQLYILFCNIFNFLDVIVIFFTGYVDSRTEIVVLDARKIAKRYIFSTFIFDVVASFPVELIFYCLPEEYCSSNAMNLSDPIKSLPDMWTMASIFRIFTCIRYLCHLCKILLWNPFIVGCLAVSWIVYCCILLTGSLYFNMRKHGRKTVESPPEHELKSQRLLSNENPSEDIYSNFQSHIKSLLILIIDCLFYSTHEKRPDQNVRIYIIGLSFIASLLFMAFFLKFSLLLMFPLEKTIEFKNNVLCMVRKRHLPTTLRNKTLLYFYFLRENKYARDDEIFNYIPDAYRAEIFYEVCLPILKNFPPFEDLPTHVLRRLAESMKYQLYLPNELITKDESCLSLYFVLRGTVAYYSNKRVELYHFEGGSSFNGKNFILGEMLSKIYAVSIELTEIYRLDHQDFVNIMETYPDLLKRVQEKVKESKAENAYLLD